MARLVVDDSTDEFPDIDVLVARARERKAAVAKSVAEGGNCVAKSVKKKRVLGRRDDNPLLRPLGPALRERKPKGGLKGNAGREEMGEVEEDLERKSMRARRTESREITPEVPETQLSEDFGTTSTRTARKPKIVGKRTITPTLKSEDLIPATTSRIKSRSRKMEKTPDLEIQETQKDASSTSSDSEAPIPATNLRLKTRTIRTKKISKSPEAEIQETQREITPSSDSEAPAPATARRIKTKTLKSKRPEKTPELEIQDSQQENNPSTARPKSRIVEKREKTPILEIPETQQEENRRTVFPRSKNLVRRDYTPLSDSEDPALITTSIFKGRNATNKKKFDTPEPDEDELSFLNSSSKTAVKSNLKDGRSDKLNGSDEEDPFFSSLEESDGMSDFVINDSEIEEVPAPRSVKRLVQGRRPEKEERHEKMDLEELMRELDMDGDESDPFAKPAREKKTKEKTSGREHSCDEHVDTDSTYSKLKPSSQTSTDLDDPFTIKL